MRYLPLACLSNCFPIFWNYFQQTWLYQQHATNWDFAVCLPNTFCLPVHLLHTQKCLLVSSAQDCFVVVQDLFIVDFRFSNVLALQKSICHLFLKSLAPGPQENHNYCCCWNWFLLLEGFRLVVVVVRGNHLLVSHFEENLTPSSQWQN